MDPSASQPPVAVYAQDGGGLGHLRRATNVAAAITSRSPATRVVIATRSAIGTAAIGLPAGTDVLKLPDFVELGSEPTGRRLLHYDTEPEVFLTLRRALLRTLLAELRPGVVVVDNEPTGAQHELADALREARAQGWIERALFGIRDIAGSNLRDERISGAPWHEVDELRPQRVAALTELYDEILVYGDPALFGDGAYGLDPAVAVPQRPVGYVFSGEPERSSDDVRASLRIPSGAPVVAVLAGAGVDGRGLHEPFLRDVAPRIGVDAVAVVVGGPFLPAADWRSLERIGPAANVRLVRQFDVVSLVHAADAVVCRGGYNSMCEAAHAGHRPIVVPRPPVRDGRIDEQQIRAEIFARNDMAVALDPDPVDGPRLARAITAELRRGRSTRRPFDPAAAGARVADAVLRRPALTA